MARTKALKIGNAGGYWGDDPFALKRQVEKGHLDYITIDFLAEITMSIMQKQYSQDPGKGFASDIVPMLKEVLPQGEESKNVYGTLDWKVLSFSDETFGEKKIVKVTAKISIVEESSGILRYGKYTLVRGSKIFLINDHYFIEGRILNWRLLKEKVQI